MAVANKPTLSPTVMAKSSKSQDKKNLDKKSIKKVLKEDEQEDSSSGDEEFDGVTEESMQKLIKVLGEDGLDDQALEQLAYLNQLEGVSLLFCSSTIH